MLAFFWLTFIIYYLQSAFESIYELNLSSQGPNDKHIVIRY